MFKVTLVTVALGLGVVYGPATPAWAQTCAEHLAQHKTPEAQDIQYHKLYGGKSPCGKNNGYKDGDERHTDEPMDQDRNQDSGSGSDGYKRDRFGYGCTLAFGCG